MKTKYLLSLGSLIVSLVAAPLFVHAQDWVWAEHLGGSAGGALIRDVHVDASGNSYVTGLFAGTVSFGSTNLSADGWNDIFVAKVDPDGEVLWAVRAGGWDADEGHAITVDSAGNVYVAGSIQGTVQFGSVSVTAPGFWVDGVFLAKYNSSGSLQWVRSGGGGGQDRARAVAVDSDGNAYITGSFSGTASFGGISLTSAGGTDIFVAKYDSTGAVDWAVRAGSSAFGADGEVGRGIAVDDSGGVYVAGHFNGIAGFGPHTVSSSGGLDAFVAKLDDGSQQWEWVVKGGGSGNDAVTRLRIDPAGDLVVAGHFAQTATFGGETLTAGSAGGSSTEDFFVAKFDPAGGLQWILQAPGTAFFRGEGLTVDSSGDILFGGSFAGTVTVGDETFTSAGFENFYIVRFDGNGEVTWATHVSGSSHLVLGGLGSDGAGNVRAGGWFQGSAEFGDHEIFHSGGSDSFLASLQFAEPIPEIEDLIVDFVIRPGSEENPLQVRSRGVLPTAILGSAELDVSEIDVSTISVWRADGTGGIVPPADKPAPAIGNVEGSDDGYPDLKLKFSVPELVVVLELQGLPRNTEVELVVSGALLDGTLFEGSDTVSLR